MTAEVWATMPAPRDPGYYLVSNLGRVWSLRNDREMKLEVGAAGYLLVRSCVGGSRVGVHVHRAVALCFVDRPSLDLNVVRHLDGDGLNNVWTNLAWGTYSENNLDMVRHGRHVQARKTHCPQGHPYEGDNLVEAATGRKGRHRLCRVCKNENARRYHARQRERGAA